MSMSIAAPRAVNVERRYYMGMILAIVACVLLGFSRSFFLRPLFPGVHAPAEPWFYVHGAVFTVWFGLLLTQASLIGSRNLALHKRLGIAGFVIVPLMVFLGTLGALIAARRPGGFVDIPVPPLEFLVVPLYELALFALFAGLGLAWRKAPQTHKRLILLAAIALAEAAIARWQFEPYLSSPAAAFWTSTLFLIPMIGWDLYSRGRVHPVTVWGGILLVTEGPMRELLSHTQSWMVFAKWATGLLA
jgi:uncharacterized membrane protein YozB (DUF420 family)